MLRATGRLEKEIGEIIAVIPDYGASDFDTGIRRHDLRELFADAFRQLRGEWR